MFKIFFNFKNRVLKKLVAQKLTKEHLLAASFPKCGNTWLRFIFANLIKIDNNIKEEVSFQNLSDYSSELEKGVLAVKHTSSTTPTVVKTHSQYINEFSQSRIIYLIRDPRDIMVSYYFYLKGLAKINFNDSLSELIRNDTLGCPALERHFKSYYKKPNVLIVRYEDLKHDTVKAVQKIFKTFNLNLEISKIELAVQMSSFENMKKIERKEGIKVKESLKKGYNFVRKGKINQWKSVLAEKDISYIQNICQSIMKKCNYSH